MNIKDYSWKENIKRRENNPLLPTNIRGLIVGKSNCGKTTLLLNLLLESWLDYNRLYVYGKSLHQLEYRVLREGFEHGFSKRQIANLFAQQEMLKDFDITPLQVIREYTGIKKGGVKATFIEDSCQQIPDPKELDPNDKNLLILDDCFLGKQNKAESYYTRGRHNNCDTLYITQNYFRLPRQTIRENSNFIILFPQDAKNLNHIHADHCSDITIEEFKEFCKKVWTEKKFNFVTLDLTSGRLNGKYRKNLDCFYLPGINTETCSN